MSDSPIICFGQQPCGFFPKRFLYAKIATARRLQKELGGEIVFFYHDADHDPRETKTLLRHHKNGEPFEINFVFENKLQRKYSPLYLKRVSAEWQSRVAKQLPAYVCKEWVEAFKAAPATNAADFCLEIYRRMGLIEGMRVVRSSDPQLRRAACDVNDFYVDVPHEGEIVRARHVDGVLKLHAGGDSFIALPETTFAKEQISPTRDSRLRWMQSVVHCTHYVAGASEQQYMRKEDAPEITYHVRDTIERSDEAYTEFSA
ncbi:MAG TPA: hypothetical protein VH518_02015 [Tepidisphaeraceae bacterium]|jgi:hypothetical protein